MADSTDDLKQLYADIEAKIAELNTQVREAMAKAVAEAAAKKGFKPEPQVLSVDIGAWLHQQNPRAVTIHKLSLDQALALASRIASGPRPPAPPAN
jgi:phage-related minor tail protein